MGNLRLILPGIWLSVLVVAAVFAPWLAPHDPLAQDLFLGRMPPVWVAGAEPGYWLGTSAFGFRGSACSRILWNPWNPWNYYQYFFG